jgi:hypothetical protein
LVDPANRMVASELERRWEQALQNLEAVEVEAGQRIDALAQPLSPADQQRLRGYAADLPTLWHAASTRIQDKKRIVRCLIENVVVTKPDEGSSSPLPCTGLVGRSPTWKLPGVASVFIAMLRSPNCWR